MVSLQAACAEIPALTNATQQLHLRITSFILEAQNQAAQLAGLAGLTHPAAGSPPFRSMVSPAMAALDPGVSMSRAMPQTGILGSMAASLARAQQQQGGSPRAGALMDPAGGDAHLYSSALGHAGGGGGQLRPTLFRNYSLASGAAPGSLHSAAMHPGTLQPGGPLQASWGAPPSPQPLGEADDVACG